MRQSQRTWLPASGFFGAATADDGVYRASRRAVGEYVTSTEGQSSSALDAPAPGSRWRVLAVLLFAVIVGLLVIAGVGVLWKAHERRPGSRVGAPGARPATGRGSVAEVALEADATAQPPDRPSERFEEGADALAGGAWAVAGRRLIA